MLEDHLQKLVETCGVLVDACKCLRLLTDYLQTLADQLQMLVASAVERGGVSYPGPRHIMWGPRRPLE